MTEPTTDQRGNVRTEATEVERQGQQFWLGKAWAGKQRDPYSYYRFRSEEKRDAWIEEQLQKGEHHDLFKAEQKERSAKRRTEIRAEIQVGTLLFDSWGYDQTNVDFFQVIDRSKTGATVTIKRICGRQVEGSAGHMCCKLTAVQNGWIDGEKQFQARVTENGVSLKRGRHASITSADREHYSSWYA